MRLNNKKLKQQKDEETKAMLLIETQKLAVERSKMKRTKIPGKPSMRRVYAPPVKKHVEKKVDLQEWQKNFITYDLGDTLEHF